MIDGRLAQTTDTLSGTRTLLTYDVFGRLLSQREYNTTNLYANTLKNGVYYLLITTKGPSLQPHSEGLS